MGKWDDLVHIRSDEVDGIKPWYWLKADQGTWGKEKDGPNWDWQFIRDEIFKYTKDRRTVIQAGGALGMYPRLFSKYFLNVYTFEPSALSFHVLTLNCQKNNIYKFNAALGNDATRPLFINECTPNNVGMNRLGTDVSTQRVAIMRIDDLQLDNVDAIQLDAEGSEPDIIDGAQQTIQRTWPVISMETVAGHSRSLLEGWGYKERARLASCDTIFSRD